MHRYLAIGALLATATLSACATTAEPEQALVFERSAEQQAAMADDYVDSSEYESGFQRYSSCMEREGYPLLMQDDPLTPIVEFAIPSAAVDSGVDQDCYESEFALIDMSWQVAHEDTSENTQILKDCLEKNGITPGETAKEVGKQLEQSGIDPATCY